MVAPLQCASPPEALIAQDSGQIVWQAEFDPWGYTLSEHDPHQLGQPIRMQGQQLDEVTHITVQRAWARNYDEPTA